MKKIAIMFLSIFLLCSCTSKENKKTVDIEKLAADKNTVIVDVRTKEEYEESHIKGAINISHDNIKTSDLDKTKTILVYCQSGNRSKQAYNTLKELGYTVYDLGGIGDIDLPRE